LGNQQQNIVEIKGLTIDFTTQQGKVKALQDVNLQIRKGEILGLVGETGCGKTITSRSIMDLLPPNAQVRCGTVRFDKFDNVLALDGKSLQNLRGNDVAMIFQDAARSLNPTMKIGDQISEALILHRKQEIGLETIRLLEAGYNRDPRKGLLIALAKKELKSPNSRIVKWISKLPYLRLYRKLFNQVARERSIALLSMVKISLPEKRVDEYPHEMSGGMRQRAMIAMALACNPKLLIADEPTTALDVTTQYQVLKLIKELKSKLETTVLIVTHNFGVVAEMCDRVAVMYAGSLVEIGTTHDIFLNPLHPYTKGLIGAIHEIGDTFEPREIPGFVPNLIDPPSGCRFHPRCTLAENVCKEQIPRLVEVRPDHWVACFPVQRQFSIKDVSVKAA
jgi:oligopeptide/dipeptide ABC transporter ATP-binding protein